MKKDMVFAPVMLLIGILLFLLRATGSCLFIKHLKCDPQQQKSKTDYAPER